MDYEGIQRKDLLAVLQSLSSATRPMSANSRKALQRYIEGKIANVCEEELPKKILSFCGHIEKNLKKYGRRYDRFSASEGDWLNESIYFQVSPANNIINLPEKSEPVLGRPKKVFLNCSLRTKKRKVESLVRSHSCSELVLATESSLYNSGQRTAASVVKEATQTSSNRAEKIKVAMKQNSTINKTPYSPEEALALIVDLKLSVYQYNTLRFSAKKKGFDIYPSYWSVSTAKKNCYPSEGVTVTESAAEVRLQPLLDITAKRLVQLNEDSVKMMGDGLRRVEIIYKWGMDGSSGQRQYKQCFKDDSRTDDANLLLTSLVPLVMNASTEEENNNSSCHQTLWKNPKTSSVRFCRRIRFQLKKVNKETTKEEFSYIQNQIDQLSPTILNLGNQCIQINHKLLFTMVDAKVCNSLTDTASQKCFLCGDSPKEFNQLEQKKSLNVHGMSFGLSPLHAYINFFQCLLRIAYKLEIKSWQARTFEQKGSVKSRKGVIIKRFREETDLIVDQPKEGAGTSNDGNTARRFFNCPDTSADITGINEELIRRFSTILRVISTGLHINTETFQTYAAQTANLYVELYPWYPMTPTVHKILVHGAEVIEHFILPIGQLAEDAQESLNKDFRYFREHRTRKISRVKTNEDLLHSLLVSSDPLISGNSRSYKTPCITEYPPEVLELVNVLNDEEKEN